MQTILLVFYSYICFSLVFVGGAESIPSDDEVSALLTIKSAIVDPMNHLRDWRKSKSVQTSKIPVHCNWTGVYCNEEGFVEKLILSNMNLSGNVSDRIQRFGSLRVLDLSRNGFESSLPKSLSNLTSLKSIELSMNGFSGNFPHGLGMATGLSYVNASNNNFSGFLPEDLGNATMLESLDLRGGYFRGTIPSSFKNLKNLRFLGVSGNSLGGKLPSEIGELSALEFGNLKNLRYLDLAVGNLTGEVPSSLGRLKQLMTLYLYENNFNGKIPQELGNITSLVSLDLSDNQISGEIPEEITDLKNLQLLNLMRNRLKGRIPEKIGELQSLEVLELWQNNLNGYLPANLGKNSPLKWLDVSSNSLSGEIPSGLCDSGNLTKLILFNNYFSGLIPSSLSTCRSLVRVRIQNNLISGSIPAGLGSLPMLQRLELAKNNLSGYIPEDLASSVSISFLDVSSNNLKSSIPSSLFSSPKLQTFIASNNDLEGKIPDQFQDCPSVSILDLSSNSFSGEIPESIASCEKLVNLNLRNNGLTGEIPKSLAKLPTLAILDLSNNSLTGKIPGSFGASPALETFNLSFNKLEGSLPSTRLFATINPNDLIGNSGLCGGVLPPCPRLMALPESWRHPGKVHVNHVIFGFVIGTSVVLSLAIIFCIGRCVYRRWDLYNGYWRSCLFLKKPSEEWPWRLVAFQRVCFTANDILACVKESNIIGMGATGIVYKAEVMKRPHTVVAVKKLWRSPQGDVEEEGEDLFNEVSLLGRLRHRNIVRLLGYVHNESEVMVIYEFMPNGNLGSALHSNDGKDGKKMMTMLVDWVSRYNVAVGVAQGLDYLHNDCHPPVIHRDIKSNNILLDSKMEARIADFGLARMMIHKNETVSMVAGSYGYIAPEYGYTLKVDEKSDIYSYGVVLLELVTGKMPLDRSFGESTDIVGWIREKMKKNTSLEEVLDPNISGECKNVKEEMLLALRIALLCTAKLPKDRPTMGDVISMLGEAKPRRKSVCQDRGNVERPVFNNSPVIGLM